MEQKEEKGLKISAASFVVAIGILIALMILTYVLTLIIPSEGIPFWKWILSPVLVLGSPQGGTLIAVMVFLLVIGGTFNALDRSGTMDYMLRKIVHAAGDKKYLLLAFVTLFFLSMGAFIGSFEECIPLVPLAVMLAVTMGWDELVGLGMSLGAVACGFATGVLNPFTTGVAQALMGLPTFSGISLRLLTFVVIYGCLLLFLIPYALKCETKNAAAEKSDGPTAVLFVRKENMEASMRFFIVTIGICFLMIALSVFIPGLSDYLMILVAVFFLVAGIGCCICSKIKARKSLLYFAYGIRSILPSLLLIMMAGSIQYTMNESGIFAPISDFAKYFIAGMPSHVGILFIFLFAMLMNFFVSSGSAEAVLLMPIFASIADSCDMSRQLMVLAFNYGDGFSNLIYFTNPCLLIALSLVGVSYVKWIKWSMKLQVLIAICCCAILLLGSVIGY